MIVPEVIRVGVIAADRTRLNVWTEDLRKHHPDLMVTPYSSVKECLQDHEKNHDVLVMITDLVSRDDPRVRGHIEALRVTFEGVSIIVLTTPDRFPS